jgi:hypothetical protein
VKHDCLLPFTPLPASKGPAASSSNAVMKITGTVHLDDASRRRSSMPDMPPPVKIQHEACRVMRGA